MMKSLKFLRKFKFEKREDAVTCLLFFATSQMDVLYVSDSHFSVHGFPLDIIGFPILVCISEFLLFTEQSEEVSYVCLRVYMDFNNL